MKSAEVINMEDKMVCDEEGALPQASQQAIAPRSSSSPAHPSAPDLGTVLLSKVAMELRKDTELRQALNAFTPPDLHAGCRGQTANLVKAHAEFVESVAINKQIVERERERSHRETARLQAELEEVKANNESLQADLVDAIATRDARDVEISRLTDAHQRERSALRNAHARTLARVRDAHATELAEQHSLIQAAEKQKYAQKLGLFFTDLTASNNKNGALSAQLVAVQQDCAARIAALQAQLDAAQQAAQLQTTQITALQDTEQQFRRKLADIRGILQCPVCLTGMVTSVYPKCCLAAVCAECGCKWRNGEPAQMVELEAVTGAQQHPSNAQSRNAASANDADNTVHAGNDAQTTVWTLDETLHCMFCRRKAEESDPRPVPSLLQIAELL